MRCLLVLGDESDNPISRGLIGAAIQGQYSTMYSTGAVSVVRPHARQTAEAANPLLEGDLCSA